MFQIAWNQHDFLRNNENDSLADMQESSVVYFGNNRNRHACFLSWCNGDTSIPLWWNESALPNVKVVNKLLDRGSGYIASLSACCLGFKIFLYFGIKSRIFFSIISNWTIDTRHCFTLTNISKKQRYWCSRFCDI